MRWLPRRSSPARLHLGTHGAWWARRSLTLTPQDARHHCHVLGVSGSGKSRFLAHWYLTLLKAGFAATFIDPHGDTARLILTHLLAEGYFDQPGSRDRLFYLDIPAAARQGRFLPFNLLAQNSAPPTIAANVKEAMHRAFPELSAGAPTFDTLLPRALRVLMHHHLPLTSLERFLLDSEFRAHLLSSFPEADIVRFFRDLLDRLRPSDQVAYVGSVLRRAQLLTDVPVLRHSLGQWDNFLQYRSLMDRGVSLVINLAVAEQEAMRLLGCLLTVTAEHAALSRGEVAPAQRGRAHFLFLDEFANFTAQSEQALSAMLSQTRKMGLFAVLANQTFSQTSERLRGALLNCGLHVAFKLGRADAESSSRLFGRVDPLAVKHTVQDEQASVRSHPVYYPLQDQWETVTQHLTELQRQHAYVRLPDDRVYQVMTPALPDVVGQAERLAEIEEEYLRRCFRPPVSLEEGGEHRAASSIQASQPVRSEPL